VTQYLFKVLLKTYSAPADPQRDKHHIFTPTASACSSISPNFAWW